MKRSAAFSFVKFHVKNVSCLRYLEAGYRIPEASEVFKEMEEKEQGRQIILDLLDKGELVNLGFGYFITAVCWNRD